MPTDAALLIAKAETKGAALRVREGQLEVRGLSFLPEPLCQDLRSYREEVKEHLCQGADQSLSEDNGLLLAWAAGLAESDVTLNEPVTFEEARANTVSTRHPSWNAVHYLTTVAYAELRQGSFQFSGPPPEWWRQRGAEALTALEGLKRALDTQGVRRADA